MRAATTGPLNIAGPGAVIDGVSLASGDPVLVKNQSDAAENGIYVFSSGGAALVRRDDANSAANLLPNTTVYVSEGDTNADTAWTLTADSPIVIGTTNLDWAQSGGVVPYSAGDGLDLVGMQFRAKADNGIVVSSDGIATDPAVVAHKYSTTIGDGTTTALAVTHGLGTRNVVVSIHDATSYEEVYPDVEKTDPNTVTLTFAVAPAVGEFVVTVVG